MSVVCTMFYLSTMVFDIKKVQMILREKEDMSITIRDDIEDSHV